MALKRSPREAPLHFRRMEIKYLLPERLALRLIDRISAYTQPDPFLLQERKGRTSYPVTSLYFDSIDLQSLREKDAGLLSRRKLRLRTYEEEFGESTRAFLEIKRRHDTIVSKDRLSLSVGHLRGFGTMSHLLGHLLSRVEATEEVAAEAQVLRSWYNLQPTALVTYKRIPFVGKHDRKFRITVDCDLRGMWKPSSLLGSLPARSCTTGYCIVELKYHHAIPAWFHGIIQDLELMRTAYSKYAMVMASLEPFSITELPVGARFSTFR